MLNVDVETAAAALDYMMKRPQDLVKELDKDGHTVYMGYGGRSLTIAPMSPRINRFRVFELPILDEESYKYDKDRVEATFKKADEVCNAKSNTVKDAGNGVESRNQDATSDATGD